MKKSLLISFTAVILSFANIVQADFTFHSSAPNACANISGKWAGTGKASNWLIGDCIYHGSGSISSVDNAGNFMLGMTADKDSGSFICPKHPTLNLNGSCINGNITIKTDYGNLVGNINESSGNAKGTLTVSPGINADVNILLQRAG